MGLSFPCSPILLEEFNFCWFFMYRKNSTSFLNQFGVFSFWETLNFNHDGSFFHFSRLPLLSPLQQLSTQSWWAGSKSFSLYVVNVSGSRPMNVFFNKSFSASPVYKKKILSFNFFKLTWFLVLGLLMSLLLFCKYFLTLWFLFVQAKLNQLAPQKIVLIRNFIFDGIERGVELPRFGFMRLLALKNNPKRGQSSSFFKADFGFSGFWYLQQTRGLLVEGEKKTIEILKKWNLTPSLLSLKLKDFYQNDLWSCRRICDTLGLDWGTYQILDYYNEGFKELVVLAAPEIPEIINLWGRILGKVLCEAVGVLIFWKDFFLNPSHKNRVMVSHEQLTDVGQITDLIHDVSFFKSGVVTIGRSVDGFKVGLLDFICFTNQVMGVFLNNLLLVCKFVKSKLNNVLRQARPLGFDLDGDFRVSDKRDPGLVFFKTFGNLGIDKATSETAMNYFNLNLSISQLTKTNTPLVVLAFKQTSTKKPRSLDYQPLPVLSFTQVRGSIQTYGVKDWWSLAVLYNLMGSQKRALNGALFCWDNLYNLQAQRHTSKPLSPANFNLVYKEIK